MNILALDTSAKAASCAVYRDGMLLCESFSDAGLTHSQTIMPMVRAMLDASHTGLDEIGAFAVSAGPGSFTGLRIGIAAVKGMAMAVNAPCAGVSSLEALAFNVSAFNGIIVPAMDARRGQVYTAVFKGGGGSPPSRISGDTAISAEDLGDALRAYREPVMLVGDGAELCHEKLKSIVPGILLAPENLRRQRASSVCAAALRLGKDEWISAESLEPVYLRLPQAERERLELKNKDTGKDDING